jgi:hypothetical protein
VFEAVYFIYIHFRYQRIDILMRFILVEEIVVLSSRNFFCHLIIILSDFTQPKYFIGKDLIKGKFE